MRRAHGHVTNGALFWAFYVAANALRLNSTVALGPAEMPSLWQAGSVGRPSGFGAKFFFDLNLRIKTRGLMLWRPN